MNLPLAYEILNKELQAEIARLRKGIEEYLEPEGHDRCWRDLIKLFQLIGKEAPQKLLTLPPKDEFLGECARYHDNLACGTEKWETVAELKEQVEELKADNRQLQVQIEQLEEEIEAEKIGVLSDTIEWLRSEIDRISHEE